MRKLFAALCLVVGGFSIASAQTINDTPLEDVDVEYIQIVGVSRFMSNKLTVNVDFGQNNNFWNNRDTRLRDENGKVIVFNSMVDAMNFMSAYGYEFVDAYTLQSDEDTNEQHYLMRKTRD